jgi:hypothetical protein
MKEANGRSGGPPPHGQNGRLMTHSLTTAPPPRPGDVTTGGFWTGVDSFRAGPDSRRLGRLLDRLDRPRLDGDPTRPPSRGDAMMKQT